MRKEYNAPLIEYLTFSAYEMFATEDEDIPASFPVNDGELGWT